MMNNYIYSKEHPCIKKMEMASDIYKKQLKKWREISVRRERQREWHTEHKGNGKNNKKVSSFPQEVRLWLSIVSLCLSLCMIELL